MSELKLISPLLDDFIVGDSFSDHDGVRCYPAMRNNTDERYILKVISIPASQVRLDALLLSGAFKDNESAKAYFSQLANDVKDELDILDRLAKMEGFLSYDAFQIAEKESASGYDVYLLGKYKRSLERHFRKYPMTHLAAMNLGLDMCACLSVCRQAGYLYADLKPGNIYITDSNAYRIGDLGFLPIVSLKYASLPDRYRSAYTPPELADPFAPIDPSIDIYAAGLILYQAYNGGNLPFAGQAPNEVLPPPLYADYEISEIILKACDPNPDNRWEDPIKMGQALVSYMQRNVVNDTPIIPPSSVLDEPKEEEVEEFEQEPEEGSEEAVLYEQADEAGQLMIEQMLDFDAQALADIPESEEAAADATEPAEEEDIANLSFMDQLTADETAPQEETAEEVVYSELTDDVSTMLEQADDLIAHEAPAPAVAPEPIEVAVPELILPEPEDPEAAEEGSDEVQEDPPADESGPDEEEGTDFVDETVAAISEAVASTEVAVSDGLPEEEEECSDEFSEDEEEPELDEEETGKKRNLRNKILAGVLAALLVACLAVAGILFYRNYYIKTIDDIQLQGVDNTLTVSVSTSADHSLLTVVCTDTYGNKNTAPLENGFATFTDLTPDNLYTITVEISGFHGLKGKTRATYNTMPQTEIMNLEAVAGMEAGTVILNFTPKGQGNDQWVLTCTTVDEPALTVNFSGHMASISGLTVGKTYTLTLNAAGNATLIGKTSLDFTVTELVYAEELKATQFDSTGLVVTWEEPKDVEVNQWTVLCYNSSGFSQNISTEENTVTFENLDTTTDYNVKVTASGMSDGKEIFISSNAVTVSAFNTTVYNGKMDINWEYTGNEPTSPWVLTYTIDGYNQTYTVATNGASASISAIAPGAVYNFKLQLQDGVTTVIGSDNDVTVPAAADFAGFGIEKQNMTWRMCLQPEQAEWTRFHVTSYQTTFAPGEKAGFVAYLHFQYGISHDPLTLTYVIRNEQGQVISVHGSVTTWTGIWRQFYGQFNVPTLPQAEGKYVMDIYFNGASVHQQNFTIVK